jgi:serine/threonine protein kinase
VAIGDGLAELHAENVVHGQITASSIVVTPKEKAKLLDVGLTGWQAPAAKSRDPREDVRALAAVLAPVALAGSQLPELKDVLQRAQGLLHEQTIDSAAALVAELMGLEAILDVRSGDARL